MHRLLAALAVGCFMAGNALAQATKPPAPAAYALRNATLVRTDGTRLAGVTIVVRRGFIEAIGPTVEIPADAKVLEGDSLLVYPGIVDAQGGAKLAFPEPSVNREELEPWNPPRLVQGFTPHRRGVDYLQSSGADLKSERTKGVVAGAVLPEGPVMPGQAALLAYRPDAAAPGELVLDPEIGVVFSLQGARGVYPATLFAVTAFMRQSFEDARRDQAVLAARERDPRQIPVPRWDPDYAVLRDVLAKATPVFFAADKAEDIRLVLALSDEFGFRPVIVGGDEAWKVAALLKAHAIPVLVSLDFPEPKRWKPPSPKADTARAGGEEPPPEDAAIERERREFEELYANAGKLAAAGVRFALTSGGGKADIRDRARRVIEYGLSEDQALRAITATPAELLGVPDLMRLEPGMPATFIVSDGPLFGEKTRVAYTFVEGLLEEGKAKQKAGGEAPAADVTGSWSVVIDAAGESIGGKMTLKQEASEFSGTLAMDMGTAQIRDGTVSGTKLSFTMVFSMGGQTMEFEAQGTVQGDVASGSGSGPMGDFNWKATRTSTPQGGTLR